MEAQMQDAAAESNEENVQAGRGEATSSVPTLDRDVLANLRGLPDDGGDDILNELIDLFLQDAPSRLLQMGRALLEGNAGTAARVAHSLKGSSANLGARGMACLCNEIEQRCHAGDLEAGRALHEALEEEFRRVFRAFEIERHNARAA
jgi:HPt (histidine-containing phosphotransfer) domain-containing protein